MDSFDTFVAPTYGRFPVTFVRAEGSYVWDDAGKRYLDFGAGVAVCSLGHCSPAMVKALETQSRTLIHCSNLYRNPWQGRLAQRLSEDVVGHPGKVFFSNSGAEVNEAMIKLARRYGHLRGRADGQSRSEILTFRNSFHGRTMAGISATGQDKVKKGFGPLLTGFRHLPFNDVEALEEGISTDTVAIMLEAVQGEGGIHVATPGFLRAAARLCREHDLLLMLDEIQCGLGRVGALCAWKAILDAGEEIVPDAVSWAKGLGGGFPLGATWISGERLLPDGGGLLCDVLGPGTHGSTFGGTPLGCAVGLAVLDEILGKDLSENAGALGRRICRKVREWNSPFLVATRGMGLMIGFPLDAGAFARNAAFQKADTIPSLFLTTELMRAGLLVVPAGTDVVRWLPPLNVTEEEADAALHLFHSTLEKLEADG